MSYSRNFFLGPFAEWLVPLRKSNPNYCDVPALAKLILCVGDDDPIFYFYENMGDLPEVKRGRGRYHRYCFMPREDRPKQPSRQMCFWNLDGLEVEDLSGVNPRAEIDWFAEAFGPELLALADYFGGPPEVRWGALCWLT